MISLNVSAYFTAFVGCLACVHVYLCVESTWGWKTGTAACCPCGCVSISMVLGARSFAPLKNRPNRTSGYLTQHSPSDKRSAVISFKNISDFYGEKPQQKIITSNELGNCSLLFSTKLLMPVAARVSCFSRTGSHVMPEDLTPFVWVALKLQHGRVTRGSDINLSRTEIMPLHVSLAFLQGTFPQNYWLYWHLCSST